LTFSNPSITLLNASGSTVTVGGLACPNSQICTLSPSLNQVSVTTNTNPFPLTVMANTPVLLDIDLNLTNSLQGNISVTPAIAVNQLTSLSASVVDTINTNGQITSVSGNSFTMIDAVTGNTLTLGTPNATFTNFGTNLTNCTTPNVSACLATNQN